MKIRNGYYKEYLTGKVFLVLGLGVLQGKKVVVFRDFEEQNKDFLVEYYDNFFKLIEEGEEVHRRFEFVGESMFIK
jgi:hypothetical protein